MGGLNKSWGMAPYFMYNTEIRAIEIILTDVPQ